MPPCENRKSAPLLTGFGWEEFRLKFRGKSHGLGRVVPVQLGFANNPQLRGLQPLQTLKSTVKQALT